MILQNKLLAFVNIDVNFSSNETRAADRNLKTHKKKDSWECPIACVAMLVGHSYKKSMQI